MDDDLATAIARSKETKDERERREEREFQRALESSRQSDAAKPNISGTIEILISDDEDMDPDSKLAIQQIMIEEDRKLAIQIQK